MSQSSPDARAVTRALDTLTTTDGGASDDATTTPVRAIAHPVPAEAHRVRTEQGPADGEQVLRWSRRESLLALLARAERGRPLTGDEARTLRHHVETEIREADTARAEAQRQERMGLSAIRAAKALLTRRTTTLRERAEKAETDLERARRIAVALESEVARADAERRAQIARCDVMAARRREEQGRAERAEDRLYILSVTCDAIEREADDPPTARTVLARIRAALNGTDTPSGDA